MPQFPQVILQGKRFLANQRNPATGIPVSFDQCHYGIGQIINMDRLYPLIARPGHGNYRQACKQCK
jgi:hypothetical protein